MLEGFFWEYPVSTVTRVFEPEVLSEVHDECKEWNHVLIGDKNSNVQFWVDVTQGYWEFNQFMFDRANSKDRFLEQFFNCEDVILAVDTLAEKMMEVSYA